LKLWVLYTYKSLEEVKKTNVFGWPQLEEAHEAILHGIRMFNQKFGKKLQL